MKYLYTPEEARRWKQRSSRRLYSILVLIALTLTACIILCRQVNTGNAQSLLVIVIALSTLAGWVGMLLFYFSYSPAKAQTVHIQGILSGEKDYAEGILTLHKESFRIPKSITVRKATLQTTDGPLSVSVSAALARQLPTGVSLRVETVRRFITAYEVIA